MKDKANSFVEFVTAITGVIGVPIRGLLVTIGHSTVTAWLLLGICIIFATYIWSGIWRTVNEPYFDAARREHEAKARYYELQNAEKELKSPALQFRMVSSYFDSAGVALRFPVSTTTTLVQVFWTATPVADPSIATTVPARSGIFEQNINPAPETTGLQTFTLPSTHFGDAWTPGTFFEISVIEQTLANGQRSRYVGKAITWRVPEGL